MPKGTARPHMLPVGWRTKQGVFCCITSIRLSSDRTKALEPHEMCTRGLSERDDTHNVQLRVDTCSLPLRQHPQNKLPRLPTLTGSEGVLSSPSCVPSQPGSEETLCRRVLHSPRGCSPAQIRPSGNRMSQTWAAPRGHWSALSVHPRSSLKALQIERPPLSVVAVRTDLQGGGPLRC